ncbi:hypothetical protein E5676_scaffold83G00690 [Cucumis melo var. makuwa]|uniref:Uncharacterized protein n=1 Tax=Cucumis melo var. makuwa TaxID=1194695 RepID=A0A5D3C2I0_CUCMM|nr:hypothetical protein E5676_scaffold83G00690 [Cucumis melo var. makuwa]
MNPKELLGQLTGDPVGLHSLKKVVIPKDTHAGAARLGADTDTCVGSIHEGGAQAGFGFTAKSTDRVRLRNDAYTIDDFGVVGYTTMDDRRWSVDGTVVRSMKAFHGWVGSGDAAELATAADGTLGRMAAIHSRR